jgi:hypothetical protein
VRCSEVRGLGRRLLDLEVCFAKEELAMTPEHGESMWGAPIKIGGFDVTETFWLTGTEKDKICWDEIIILQPDDVTDSDILPLYRIEGGVWCQHFGETRIEVCVRLMSFLFGGSKDRTSRVKRIGDGRDLLGPL